MEAVLEPVLTGITITERAAREVRKIMNDQGLSPETYLRLGVKGGGCSGLSYTIGFADTPTGGDEVYEQYGIRVVVDPKSHMFMDGVEFGFEESIIHRGFKFENPQAKKSCSCGTSFS